MSEFHEEDVRSLTGTSRQSDTPDEDSEIDFDDETDDDQLPLDEVEAEELGVNLDNPESSDDDTFL